MLKTLFIVDNCEADLKFFIKEGDYKHLDRIYANSCCDEGDDEAQQAHEEKCDEVCRLLNSGKEYPEHCPTPLSTTFPPKDQYDEVVIIGYIP